jgi:hypothetical protein
MSDKVISPDSDPLLEEVRETKRLLLERFDYDVDRLLDYLQENKGAWRRSLSPGPEREDG